MKADDFDSLPYGGCSLDAADSGAKGLLMVSRILRTWKAEVLATQRRALEKMREAMEEDE
ncbi:MAG: hypothetical protein RBU30_17755 [Polyangia bacterium]|nr:hypothetical protein [Polyangia bacterium]